MLSSCSIHRMEKCMRAEIAAAGGVDVMGPGEFFSDCFRVFMEHKVRSLAESEDEGKLRGVSLNFFFLKNSFTVILEGFRDGTQVFNLPYLIGSPIINCLTFQSYTPLHPPGPEQIDSQ